MSSPQEKTSASTSAGSKGWTAAENLSYFHDMQVKRISEDAPEADEIWKTRVTDRPLFPIRAPSAFRQHTKDVISDVRSMSNSFSSANADARCPTFEAYSKSIDGASSDAGENGAGLDLEVVL